MVTVFSESDVQDLLDLESILAVVASGLRNQTAGDVERPERPHYPVGTGLDGPDPEGTGLVMPAYCHGDPYSATKLVGVHEKNTQRGLPTIHAQIVLTDARTGVPEAFFGATTITNARTGCLGGLAVRELAPEADTLGILGAGAQARWQARAIATVTDLAAVRVYSPSDSRLACAADLREREIPATAVDSPQDAVEGADIVVTATTSTEPVFPADALADGTLVVGIGAYTEEMQELPSAVLDDAAQVFADVPEEVAAIGDLQASSVSKAELTSLGGLLETGYTRTDPVAPLVVESVGTAVLDAVTAQELYQTAEDGGTDVPLTE
jgi:alanine dehydrogenase